MAQIPNYYFQPEVDQFKKGGYIPGGIIPGGIISGNQTMVGYVPSRRFPFEFELLQKLGMPMNALPEEEFLTRDGYIRYVLDEKNRREVITDPLSGPEFVVEYVKWTDEEADVINAVWHLISTKCKVR